MPPPTSTRRVAIVAARRLPVRCRASSHVTRARAPAMKRAGDDEDGDHVEPGGRGGDRPVEVGEPVVRQRDAREVGDLRWEVALEDALADRDMDQEVAPVPAAGDPAGRDLVPGVPRQDGPDQEDRERRERRTAPAPGAPPRGPGGGRPWRRGQARDRRGGEDEAARGQDDDGQEGDRPGRSPPAASPTRLARCAARKVDVDDPHAQPAGRAEARDRRGRRAASRERRTGRATPPRSRGAARARPARARRRRSPRP